MGDQFSAKTNHAQTQHPDECGRKPQAYPKCGPVSQKCSLPLTYALPKTVEKLPRTAPKHPKQTKTHHNGPKQTKTPKTWLLLHPRISRTPHGLPWISLRVSPKFPWNCRICTEFQETFQKIPQNTKLHQFCCDFLRNSSF